MFSEPFVNLYTRDIEASLAFYRDVLGFVEVFRAAPGGRLEHVEMELSGYRIGLGSVDAARRVHGVDPAPGTPSGVLVLWTHDVDEAFGRLERVGTTVVQEPHDATNTRSALVRDPDGNLIEIVARRATS